MGLFCNCNEKIARLWELHKNIENNWEKSWFEELNLKKIAEKRIQELERELFEKKNEYETELNIYKQIIENIENKKKKKS